MNETMPNQEILDATQDAVLNVATSVATVIENTAQGLGVHSSEPFYMEAEFWVGVAFIVVIIGLFRPVGKLLLKLLRDRSLSIASRIQEAVSLKEEAQRLLSEYERKFRNVKKEATEILLRSEREVESMKTETLTRLENEIRQKEKDAKLRLQAMEESMTQEISEKTSDLTISVVKKILAERLDKEASSRLIDASIERLKEITES